MLSVKSMGRQSSGSASSFDNFSISSNSTAKLPTDFKFEAYLKMKNCPNKLYQINITRSKEIYFYKQTKAGGFSSIHCIMHTLVGAEVDIKAPEEDGTTGELVHILKVSLSKTKARKLIFENREKAEDVLKHLIKITKFRKFDRFYDVSNKELGKGKYGEVILATNKKTKEKVAVKVISKRKMKAEQLQFQRNEIQILKMCSHPNIIKLIDVFETFDKIHIVLQYLRGGDLFDYLQERDYKTPQKQ
jgi:hypothetical protein